jgi:hypothetical protein
VAGDDEGNETGGEVTLTGASAEVNAIDGTHYPIDPIVEVVYPICISGGTSEFMREAPPSA